MEARAATTKRPDLALRHSEVVSEMSGKKRGELLQLVPSQLLAFWMYTPLRHPKDECYFRHPENENVDIASVLHREGRNKNK